MCSVHQCSSVRKRILETCVGEVFLSQSTQSSRRFLAHISSPQDSGPSPNPSPAGRGVVCEVTPNGLLAYFVEVFALTELTELTEPFWRTFRAHRRPPAYRIHRTLLLKKIPIRRKKAAYIQSIGVSRCLRPFPSGGGEGGGANW